MSTHTTSQTPSAAARTTLVKTADGFTKTRRFTGSLHRVSQTGAKLSPASKGVSVTLHFRSEHGAPVCAEIYSDDQSECAEIGLWFDGRELTDYDGAFDLGDYIAGFLADEGWHVPADFWENGEGPQAPAPAVAHTPEPWHIGTGNHIYDEHGQHVVQTHACHLADSPHPDTARIVVAVNFCAGVPNDALPPGGLAELLAERDRLREALERITAIAGSTGGSASLVAEFRHIARAALALAEGGAK